MITIRESIILGCGEAEAYWCFGHVSREDFAGSLATSEGTLGLDFVIPSSTEVKQSYQRLVASGLGDGSVRFERRGTPAPGFEPITFVYADEVDEK